MKIIIWDSTPARCSANGHAITSAASALGVNIEVQVWTGPRAPQNGTLTPQCDLLLLHATDENAAMSWFQTTSIEVPRILKYGGGGVGGGVPRAVSDTNPLNDFETKRILEAVRNSSSQEAFLKLALAIWSAVQEYQLALRLLCEAWSEVNLKKNKTLSGFPVHAPSKLDDWLAPFAPEGNDDAAKIASVVSNMGDNDTKEKVRNVLESANTDPTAAVKVLLKMPHTPEPTESEA